jgi:uncharacterized membrane-anchored protein
MHPVEKPAVFVGNAKEKIIDDEVKDEETKKRIRELIVNLIEWTKKISD